MAQPQRQPLGELPLSRYLPVDAESSSKFKKAASLSPAGILSPPKRRILAAEGLLSPSSSSKSPARRLLFASAADTPRSGSGSSVMSQLAADMVQVAMASTPHHHSSSSSASSSNYSSVSSSSSSSLVSSPTTSSRSASKLSVDTTANPSTPQFSRTRPRPLAPSPEIVDSPMSFADDGPLTRPASLKRLRSTDSSSSTGGLAVSGGAPSPTKSPTPKRRNLARATSPSPAPHGSSSTAAAAALAAEAEDLFETEVEDKENVPPPRRKKPVSSAGGGFKAPLPPTSTRTGLGLRDMSATPRAVKTREPTYGTYLSPADIRTRRMAMEAEVDMPDSDENMQF